jgi:putative ABC transport system permease protein
MKEIAVAFGRAWWDFVCNDLRYASRTLAKSPVLVIVATLSLGLGTGVNTTLYSVFRSVFLQEPTARNAERMVRIEPGNSNQISYLNFRDLEPGPAFEGFAAYAMSGLNLRTGEDVEKVRGMMVSPEFFDLLGIRAGLGRSLSRGGESTAVLSYEFWQSRFADRADPLGVVLNLNGHAFEVIGVLPRNYRAVTGALGPEVYVPLGPALAPTINKRSHAFLTVLGRLREGVSQQQAQAAVTARTREIERIHPADNRDLGRATFLFPISGLGSWSQRNTPVSMLIGLTTIPFVIFGLVLLIACANVAGLLLSRGAARRREIAIRLALGSSRSRLIRTLLAESLLLSILGSIAGLLLTFWLCRLLSGIPLPQVQRPVAVTPDLTVLFYALFVMLIATLACGITPALASTRLQLADAFKETTANFRRLAGRRVLVTGQVAVSTVLLFVSTLFLRSLDFISGVHPGFDIEKAVTAQIELDRDRYPLEQRLLFATQAVSKVQALPGITSASVANLVPLGGDVYDTSCEIDGQPGSRGHTYEMKVGPAYFRTMAISLYQGREFAASDRMGGPPVAIVNQAFVRKMGLGEKPIGARVRTNSTEPWHEVVGVAADSKYAFFGEEPHPILYRSFLQTGGGLIVVAGTAGNPAGMLASMKLAIAELDKSAIVESRTMREATSLEFSLRSMGAWILGGIGVLGLALALIGLYGVMSYAVNRRMPEIGIRMAIGASRPAILWMVMRNGLALTGTGIGIGVLISLAAAQPLGFLMSGVSTFDPLSIAITSAMLAITGMGASLVPSLRAMRADPLAMLRYE